MENNARIDHELFNMHYCSVLQELNEVKRDSMRLQNNSHIQKSRLENTVLFLKHKNAELKKIIEKKNQIIKIITEKYDIQSQQLENIESEILI
jgi:hypothetical protein